MRNPYPVLDMSRETASMSIGEEGEDDVKSARRLCPGRHTSYNGRYNGLREGDLKLIP